MKLRRNGAEIHYEVFGSGPALLFAHGLGGNHLSWWQQVAHFAPRYTCVSFAHRGFAPSSAIDGGPDPADYASDLAALIDHLKFPDVRLVGPAMGMGAAARSPALHLLYASIDTMAGALDKAKVREGLRRTAHRTVTELK